MADFDVVVQELNPTEIAGVNENLPSTMNSIAPVIGKVSSTYRSEKKYKIILLVFLDLWLLNIIKRYQIHSHSPKVTN